MSVVEESRLAYWINVGISYFQFKQILFNWFRRVGRVISLFILLISGPSAGQPSILKVMDLYTMSVSRTCVFAVRCFRCIDLKVQLTAVAAVPSQIIKPTIYPKNKILLVKWLCMIGWIWSRNCRELWVPYLKSTAEMPSINHLYTGAFIYFIDFG